MMTKGKRKIKEERKKGCAISIDSVIGGVGDTTMAEDEKDAGKGNDANDIDETNPIPDKAKKSPFCRVPQKQREPPPERK